MSKDKNTSMNSLIDATKSRADFSGHGHALGAAGERAKSFDPDNCEHLREPGQNIAINTSSEGFESITISAFWDSAKKEKTDFLSKLFKKKKKINIDLDLGCLYELKDGTRGAIQAFGEKFGSFDKPPYMVLSGDERTGDAQGHDEYIVVNGAYWNKIKRLLIYIYIYDGSPSWAEINPKILIDVPGEDDLAVSLASHNDKLALCAIGGLENVRNGIILTNYTEYFPGHAEMDRAFGFGLEWDEGKK